MMQITNENLMLNESLMNAPLIHARQTHARKTLHARKALHARQTHARKALHARQTHARKALHARQTLHGRRRMLETREKLLRMIWNAKRILVKMRRLRQTGRKQQGRGDLEGHEAYCLLQVLLQGLRDLEVRDVPVVPDVQRCQEIQVHRVGLQLKQVSEQSTFE
jgi:hypothetical protein